MERNWQVEAERVSYVGKVVDVQEYLPWEQCWPIKGIDLEIVVPSVIQRLD